MTASGNTRSNAAYLNSGLSESGLPQHDWPSSEVDWFGSGAPTGTMPPVPAGPAGSASEGATVAATTGGTGTALLERPGSFGSATEVTTADVFEVLGPDAEEMLAASNLDMDELVRRLNAETTMLPPITAEFERELEQERMPAAERSAALAAADVEPADTDTLSPWKRRFLKAAIGSILLTAAGGGATAMAMSKTVTLDVDGAEQTVFTYGNTVDEVLDAEGLDAGKHDVLSPSPNAAVGDGGKIVLDRGRLLTMTVDGEQQQKWVHSGTVGEALKQLGMDGKGMQVSADRNAQIPLSGMPIEINTEKSVKLIDGAKKPAKLDTYAATVEDLLRDQGLALGKNDVVRPGAKTKLRDGMQVMVSRTGVTVVNKKQEVDVPVKEVEDSSMFEGETEVSKEGKPGLEVVTYRITKTNGEETQRQEISSKVLRKPEIKVVKVGTKPSPAPNTSGLPDSAWDALAECESSGDWSIDSGNGYYGGVQFDESTWLSNGGGQYAPTANLASREEQIAIASKVYQARGSQPWPICGSELDAAAG